MFDQINRERLTKYEVQNRSNFCYRRLSTYKFWQELTR